jgi:competence protein ComEC
VDKLRGRFMLTKKRKSNWWTETIQQLGLLEKILLIFLGIFVLCCCCSLPVLIFSQSESPKPFQIDSSNSSIEVAKATIWAEITQTESAQISDTPIPTAIYINTIEPNSNIPQFPGNVQVTFIDVGQGDAILIRSPEGLYGLIDGGESDSGIVQYLQSQGVQNLSLIVATHPNSDHIGGLIAVLQTIPTARIVTNGETHTTIIYESFLDAIVASKAEYIEAVRGNTLSLGSLVFDILNPGKIIEGGLNRNSVVLRMTYGITTFLFTGDANIDTETEMLATGLPLSANVLKIGHHGSITSTSSAFLEAVHPLVAVYMAGKGNSYGLPSPDTLAKLNRLGVNILGTDVNGTIIFLVDKSGYTIHPSRQEQIPAPPVIPLINTKAASSTGIFINVASLTSPVSPNRIATLTIQTIPGAACSITVYYKSGPSQAAGLGPQTADASGQATWSWKIGSKTTPGIWKIVVNSQLNGEKATLSIPFEVQK